MKTAAIILVPPKEVFNTLDETNGLTPITRLLLTLRFAGIKRIVVTGGSYMRQMVRYFGHIGAEFIYPKKSDEMNAGIVNTIKYLTDKCDRVVIIPVQYYLVEQETFQRLAVSKTPVEIPSVNGNRGMITAVNSGHFNEIIAVEGDIRGFIDNTVIAEMETEDLGIVTDMSKYKKPERQTVKHSLYKKLRPTMKITIARDRSFFGPGILQLMRLIEETQSLKRAGEIMGIANAYSLKLANSFKRNMNTPAFSHKQKGRAGGISTVTDECLEFMKRYEEFTDDCERYMKLQFEKYFSIYND